MSTKKGQPRIGGPRLWGRGRKHAQQADRQSLVQVLAICTAAANAGASRVGDMNGGEPPHSTPSEQALLGVVLNGLATWQDVSGLVESKDFYVAAHREIVGAMVKLSSRGEPCDFVTVAEALEAGGRLEDAGGLAYVGSLAGAAGAATNAPSYCRIIREKAAARRLMDLGGRLAAGPNGAHVVELLAATRAELDALAEQTEKFGDIRPPKPADLIATEQELQAASLHPRAIVRDHTFADVAQVIAPGGVGKTTLLIAEAVHIAIGRPVWGLEVVAAGWSLFVTAEDRRAQILARLREILATLDLNDKERADAIRGVRVWDVTGEAIKLVRAADGNVILTRLADDIVDAYRGDPPAVVIFDPLVSFGASEGMVNDNEQGVITAARRIVKGLGCCVRVVHHTGKGNARERTLDQYSGRGGSAMSDGSRMTTVLQRWTPDDGGALTPPPGCNPDPRSSITILARAKLSYSPPNLPLIWIKRTGFHFEAFTELPQTRDQARAMKADQLLRFLASELAAGRYHTQKTLEDAATDIGMTRTELRGALSGLRASMAVYDANLPEDLRRGGRKTYLAPSNLADKTGEVAVSGPPAEASDFAASTTSPPLRERNGGEVAAPFSSPLPCNLAEEVGEVPARWRGNETDHATDPEEFEL